MENKKLIEILMKDMSELEELIAEIKANRRFDTLEMEFIHTRAKGIFQLMQLFKSKGEEIQEGPEKFQLKAEEQTELPERKEPVLEKPEKAVIPEKREKIKEGKPQPEKPENEEFQKEEKEFEKTVSLTETPVPEEAKSEEPVEQADAGEEDDDDMLEEESETHETASRLGDSFLKGKSVNDLITEQHKLEFKLSNRPVSSIQSAIGINDRFQYIRELFDNDSSKFLEAVKTLDSRENIKDAVDYLRQNFKWKKNETSLKFVNLVKRRFLNE
jgi:hypothetical protein